MEADALFDGHDVYGLGKKYSMPMDVYEEIPAEKHLVFAEVDIYGMRRLKTRYPDCVSIFVTAPPLDLLERIRERKDDFMDDDALAHRMRTAYDQFSAASEFDYLVFNQDDRLSDTIYALESIILAERNRVKPGFELQAAVPQDALTTPSQKMA
jgi:guanylate kinase